MCTLLALLVYCTMFCGMKFCKNNFLYYLCVRCRAYFMCVASGGGVGSSYYHAERNFALRLHCL
jgi:hypothetical protein